MAQLEFNDESNILISPYLWQKFRVPRQAMKGGRAIDVSYIRLFAGLHPLTTRARMARDVFLLSFMLMGMNSVDMFGTDLKLKDGRICYHRAKTSDRRQDGAYIEVAIPLVASKIISRYYDRSRVFNFHRKYSTSADFNRAINIGLHVILPDLNKMAASGGLAPLDKLQFYQARHSWASIARNDCRIDKSTVGEGLNHVERDTRITDIYIKKDFNLINEANDRIQHFVWGDMVVD